MSESQTFGFAKLVPGFDFLQNLTKASTGGGPAMAAMASWVAPTLNVEDLDKRIQELRAVHFWLEQNGKALEATIQALEVQKMTLSTLRGMNLNMSELAEALKMRPETTPDSTPASTAASTAAPASAAAGATPTSAQVDPLQWWTALSQQFQQIASTALKDVAEASARPTPVAADRKPAAPKPESKAQTKAQTKAKPRTKATTRAKVKAKPASRKGRASS